MESALITTRRLEFGNTHVHRDPAVGLQPRHDDSTQGTHPELRLGREPPLVYVARKAAHTVSALFHLPPVGIEDAVVEVGPDVAGPLDLQDLVAAHPTVAVGKQAHLAGAEGDWLGRGIEHHEVVTQAVHFSEF